MDAVHDAVDSVAFGDHFATGNTAVKGVSLVGGACREETGFGIQLNVLLDLVESVLQDEAQREGDEQGEQNELFHGFEIIYVKSISN